MRPDMQHVLIDRPRRGSWLSHHGFRNMRKFKDKDIEEAPTKESMKARYCHGWMQKEQSDHIRPLERYLRTNCGKPWAKVYSEICKNIKLDSTMQRHVRGHVDGYVETNTFVGDDGRVWVTGGQGSRSSDYSAVYPIDDNARIFRVGKFYVDPRNGLLCELKRSRDRRYHKPPEPKTKVVLGDLNELHLIDKVWYHVTFKPFPTQESPNRDALKIETIAPAMRRRDVLTGERLQDMWRDARLPWWQAVKDAEGRMLYSLRVRPTRFAATKRQLSGKELKKYGLRNET